MQDNIDKILKEAQLISNVEPEKITNEIYKIGNHYLIFESSNIYTKVEELIRVLTDIQTKIPKGSMIMEIPFFIGLNSNTLSSYLTGVSENGDFHIPYSFEVLPADFNIQGLNKFATYVNLLKNKPPVYNDLATYDELKNYLVELTVGRYNGQLERVLPIYLRDREAITKYDAITEIQKEILEEFNRRKPK